MATTKETMKVIANGIDKKKAPEVIVGGKVIEVEVPDEVAEVLEGLIGSLISSGDIAGTEPRVRNQNNNGNCNDPDDFELTQTDELAGVIAIKLAACAAKHFMRIVEPMDTEVIQTIVKNLEESDPKAMVDILRVMFTTHYLNHVARELHLLDLCQAYSTYSYEIFQDCFLEDERIDWYSVENWLKEKNIQHNSKLS